jgi:hypothetical protein
MANAQMIPMNAFFMLSPLLNVPLS